MPDDRVRASDYDDPMSGRLLGIAADVLRSFGSAFGGRHLAIVGGAVPALLVPEVPPGITPHVGTADLDLHLSLHLLDGETADYYQAIIDGLRSLQLSPATQSGREIKWRWVGRYRDTHVQVELLCPVRTRAGRLEQPANATVAEANIGPSGEITALAVGFGHLVPEDTITVQRRVETRRGMLAYEFPVAGIASWLCLKADAIMKRDKAKDAYDVVWLTDALGPHQIADKIAASPLLVGQFSAEVIAQLSRLIDDQFRDIQSAGPIMYAEFLEAQPKDAELRHAHGAIAALGEELRKRGIGSAAL
jgi:Nucleotidyl transferase AbiEii toxin, Type IV TA system